MADKLPISKDEWDEYRDIQESGLFNMYDPRARKSTSLSTEKWLYLIENYEELSLIYEGGANG